MAEVLKMVFKISDTQTHTLSLKNPKTGLTRAQTETCMNNIIAKNALTIKGIHPKAIKTAYIQRIEDVELA